MHMVVVVKVEYNDRGRQLETTLECEIQASDARKLLTYLLISSYRSLSSSLREINAQSEQHGTSRAYHVLCLIGKHFEDEHLPMRELIVSSIQILLHWSKSWTSRF